MSDQEARSAAYILVPAREVQTGDVFGGARVTEVRSNEDGWTWVFVDNGTTLSRPSDTPTEVQRATT